MKILFVQKMNGISGSELYMLQIMPELKRRGYDVEMLIVFPVRADKNEKFISYLAEYGIPAHEIYGHGTLSPLLFYKINKLLKKGNYDIVQSNLVHADFWVAVMKVLRPGLKMVSVKHGYHPSYQAKHGHNIKHLKWDLYYWVERFASRRANFNLTISKGLYTIYVDGKIINPSRIRNIYYGLTLTKPVFNGKQVEIPVGPYVMITGRLVSFKGHTYLIDAWKKVHARHPEVKLYFAGEGYRRTALEQQIKEAGLQDTIILLGHTPNPHPLMENCLFTIVSSIWEGFGLILLESWLHKKPVVAFDAPAMNEVIDDHENGLLAKAQNSEDLADKIIYLYEHKDLIPKMGENGHRKLMDYYTLKRMTDETEQVYKAVVEKQPVPLG